MDRRLLRVIINNKRRTALLALLSVLVLAIFHHNNTKLILGLPSILTSVVEIQVKTAHYRSLQHSELQAAIQNQQSIEEKISVQKYFSWHTPTSRKRSIHDATDPLRTTYVVSNGQQTADSIETKKEAVLQVKIVARNGRGEQKKYGGDYFHVVLRSSDQQDSINAAIEDHNDGTYTAQVPIYFDGEALLTVTLVHSSEAVDLLRRVTSVHGSPGLIFVGVFSGGRFVERTLCNVWLPSDNATTEFCNFSRSFDGELWYCRKPSNLNCNDIQVFEATRNEDDSSILLDSGLFTSGTTLRVVIGKPQTIKILPGSDQLPSKLPTCTLKDAGADTPKPAGYFLRDRWQSLHCSAERFIDGSKQAECLENKNVYIFGDSTIRQWYSYYVKFGVLNKVAHAQLFLKSKLPLTRSVIPYETVIKNDFWEPSEAFDYYNNITFHFSAHGPPLQNGGSPRTVPYISDRIDAIDGGPNTVVVFTIGMHLLLYDPTVYVRRLETIRDAVIRLLSRSPDTLVVYKGMNTFTMDEALPSTCCLSEWLAYRYNEIARKMFKEIPIIYLDCWDMTIAHALKPDGLHPQLHIVENEIELFLSYVCPKSDS